LQEQLSELVKRLQTAFADRLVSVVLYGSAAMNDRDEQLSDLNVLCVLDRIAPTELARSEPIFRWWMTLRNPAPLLLTAEEVTRSTDCFPMEFHDMQEHRRVLHGADVIDGLEIDRSFYRAQVEHELRAKQIRLRQKAAELLSDSRRLTRLMADSLSTYCVLGRHALILAGREPKWKKREILEALTDALGTRLDGASELLAIRENGKLEAASEPVLLLEKYMSEMESLVRYVDGLSR
jgi:predicted nucleotidyltransferase